MAMRLGAAAVMGYMVAFMGETSDVENRLHVALLRGQSQGVSSARCQTGTLARPGRTAAR